MKIYEKMLQGSEEWLRARKGIATASEAAKILTPTGRLSKQADDYILKLCRETLVDDPLEFLGNKRTDWGNQTEAEAREIWASLHPQYTVEEVGFVRPDADANGRALPIGCSPDALLKNENGQYVAGLEIKCPSPDTHVRYLLDGGVPAKYLPQVHWSMVVTGLRTWHFISYFPNLRPHLATATWDDYTDKLQATILEFVQTYAATHRDIMPKISA